MFVRVDFTEPEFKAYNNSQFSSKLFYGDQIK